MLRTLIVICLLALSTPAAHADADRVRDRIVSILKEDGYLEIRISRTLLGRMRFVAMRSDARREIVVNPNSGVILRDYVRFLNQRGGASSGSGTSGGGQEGYNDEYDDEYDDDHDDDDDDDSGNSGPGGGSDDDDDDDDNSGSGSSNSGSGSSNSGSDDDDDD